MAPRTRKEKEQFFADLDGLDHHDGEDEEFDSQAHKLAQVPKPVQASKLAAAPVPPSSAQEIPRKRKISSPQLNERRPPAQPTRPGNEILRPSTSDASTAPPAFPASLGRTQSEKLPPTKKGKKGGKKTGEVVPEEERIFEGLVLFFIPNSDDEPVRRYRIQRAIAHGATWARSWDEPVTQVIIDSGLHIKRASRELRDKKLPHGIPVVKDEWLVECLKYKDLRNPNGTRFRVAGMVSPFELEAAGEETNNSAPDKEIPRSEAEPVSKGPAPQGVNEKGKEQDRQDQQPLGRAEAFMPHDLDLAIEEVQKLGDLPASLLEDETSFSSEPGSSFPSFELTEIPEYPPENTGFQCMEKHDGNDDNPNRRTMEILQLMALHYDQMGDRWRTRAYRIAIGALRKQTTLVRTKKEALALRRIGHRLADKIEEIVITDRLRRLESTLVDPNDKLLRLFMSVYGAGYRQASRWIAQGHRTLDDLREKASLTPNQKIGIDHYDDFKQRIPRGEVERHAAIVKAALRFADKELEMIVGGSYRRGNADSGDVDLIITKEDAGIEHLRTLVMEFVVPHLTEQGFLKAALATGDSRGQGSKWHGASALPESSVWRRIDLLFVPWAELGAALIYFTGNDIFNRSMRLLASRKGMRLNQHGLFKDVIRGRSRTKVTEGQLVEGHSERRIFELLGVPYRPPEHRKC